MEWTSDRVDLLKKLWADGLSDSQIAKQLGGITRNSVAGKLHRLKLVKGHRQAIRPKKHQPALAQPAETKAIQPPPLAAPEAFVPAGQKRQRYGSARVADMSGHPLALPSVKSAAQQRRSAEMAEKNRRQTEARRRIEEMEYRRKQNELWGPGAI